MKKKILIIIGSLDLGGTEKQLLKITKKLCKYYSFTILTFHKKGLIYKEFEKLDVDLVDISGSTKINIIIKSFKIIYKIKKLLKKINPEIVHYYLPQSYILGGIVSYFDSKRKLIMSRRSMNQYQKKYFFVSLLEKVLHKKMNLIFANSQAVKKQLLEEECVKEDVCKIIYNGINNPINLKKSKDNKKVSILCLANLIPYKNHNLIISACAQLSSNLDYKILLAGSGNSSYVNQLKNRVNELNLKEKIVFLGQVKDPTQILTICDIGILVSDEEGFSNTILEYMSYKLPIIATKVGGNSESIKDGLNGFLIEKNNIQQLKEKLTLLIGNRKLRKKMGSNGSEISRKEFGLNNTVKMYKYYYDNLLN